MTADVDLDRSLASWLEAETTAAPDDSLDRAMSRIGRTRQRPRWLVVEGLNLPTARAPIAVPAWVLVALAVLVAAAVTVVGARLLTNDTAPTVRPTPSMLGVAPSLRPTVQSSSPTPSPSTSPTSASGAAWTATGSMTVGRARPAAVALPDGRILVVGGYTYAATGSDPAPSAELYDPRAGTWTVSKVKAPIQASATLLRDGSVLVAGGGDGTGSATAELYDPTSDSLTQTGSMTRRCIGDSATLLPDGRVLVVCGDTSHLGGTASSAEVYDPVSRSWTATGSIINSRIGSAGTLLPTGKVLVVGGEVRAPGAAVSYRLTPTAELFDPASGTWSQTGAMAEPRSSSSATLLPDGTVLVAGGTNEPGLDPTRFHRSAEVYDPVSGTWSATGSMVEGRGQLAATLLTDGKVLVTGGDNGQFLDTAELYDPATRSWTATASMALPRATHVAVLLDDGTVLVAGGYAGGGGLTTAEIYHPGSGQ
jgi:Kelch motif protein/galactose oxidase-like protein